MHSLIVPSEKRDKSVEMSRYVRSTYTVMQGVARHNSADDFRKAEQTIHNRQLQSSRVPQESSEIRLNRATSRFTRCRVRDSLGDSNKVCEIDKWSGTAYQYGLIEPELRETRRPVNRLFV
jgi:hypothetical protein